MKYTNELRDRVRQNLRMFDYPRFDDGDIDALLDEIDRLTTLLTRMQSVGDEMSNNLLGGTYCCYLHERWSEMTTDDCGNYLVKDDCHAPDCPVTRWHELKKEMEG